MQNQSADAARSGDRAHRKSSRAPIASALTASILFAGLLPPLHAHISSLPDATSQHLSPVASLSGPKKASKPAGLMQELAGKTDVAPIASAVLYFGLAPTRAAEQAETVDQRIAPVAQVGVSESTGTTAAPVAKSADGNASNSANPSAIDEARLFTETWAQAWSARDFEHYIDAYSKNFTPEQGLTRGVWEQARRQKIEGRKSISVTIRDLKIDADGKERMRVHFLQDYAADNFHETGTPKLLILAREDGAWRIIGETTENERDARK